MQEKTILIVDDDPEMHDLIRSMLKDTPWKTESALNGEAALQQLRNRAFDLILTDILMPEMDGLTLLNGIRAIHSCAKVLVMTAFNNSDNVVRSLRGHAAGYLKKPFSRAVLLNSIEEVMESNVEADDIEVISDTPNWISVKARCKLETAERLTRFFNELPIDLDVDQREQASMAFRELLMNAVEHGGRLDPEQKVELHLIRTASTILYFIRDPGQGFSMKELPHAAISHPDDPMEHAKLRQEMGIRPGGFGLLLLKNFADELIYSAKGNEVILIKRL